MNQMLYRHQMAAMNAQHASMADDRDSYLDLARECAKEITDWREARSLSSTGWPQDQRDDTVTKL